MAVKRKKRKKKKLSETLRDSAWKLCREIKKAMTGGRCELCGETPEVFDLDHCFSRMNGEIHFRLSNLTVLCKSCHFKKSKRIGSAESKVYEIVKKREGVKEFKNLQAVADKKGGFPQINQVWWLEEKIEHLKQEKERVVIRWD